MFFVLRLALRFLINPIAAAGFLKFQDINIVQALLIIWLATFVNLGFTYYGVGTLVKQAVKYASLWVVRKLRGNRLWRQDESRNGRFRRLRKCISAFWRIAKSILERWSFKRWLSKRSVWILYIALLLPLPYLASVAVVATKMNDGMDGREKAIVLISANFLKGVMVVLSIYYFPILVAWHN